MRHYSYREEDQRCAARMRTGYAMRQYQPDRSSAYRNETMRYFMARNEEFDVRRKTRLRDISTAEAAVAYCKTSREKLVRLIGEMPSERPCGARVTGRFSMHGYAVENLLIESLPGYWLTANFYLPEKLSYPAPGLLFLCGHTANGKAGDGYAAFCAEAAVNGFCVLTFDPVGQGERFFLDERDAARIPGNNPDAVHCHIGGQLFLLGESLNKHMLWDCLRALDYLCARPEIDTDRVGVTGNSGGGQACAFVGAYDERVRVVAPSCYITQFAELAHTAGIQEIEQDVYGMMREGLDLSDLMNAAAPRPYCVSGGLYDFFPIEGLRDATVETRRLYALMGAEDGYEVFIGPRPHGLFTENRRHIIGFLCKHLMDGKKATFPEEGIDIPEESRLLCAGGDVRSENTADLLDYCRTRARKARRENADNAPIAARVAEILGMRAPETPSDIRRVASGADTAEFSFFAERHMKLYATLYDQADAENGLWVRVGEGARPEGEAVLQIEPRGTGRAAVPTGSFYASENGPYMNDEAHYTWNALLLGQSMLGMRAGDVLAGIGLARGLTAGPIRLYAEGRYALYALIAALTADVRHVRLKGLLTSFADIAAGKDYTLNIADMGFGVLRAFDIDDLIAAVRARGIGIDLIGRTDAMGRLIGTEER